MFTDAALEGNALAVFTEPGAVPPELMQKVAREMNLSETVFVTARDGAGADIRIFTPYAELPFAGHPVLGTAFVLASERAAGEVVLRTASGPVPVALRYRDGVAVEGEMQQPLPRVEAWPEPQALLAALGGAEAALPVEVYDNGPRHVMVALRDERQVAALQPDLGQLARLGEVGVSCFAASPGSGGDVDVLSRMFAPGLGVAEDPATGSAAGPLAAHLLRHGRAGSGQAVRIRQGQFVARPSLLVARAFGSAERLERVSVSGAAVVVARGELFLRGVRRS